ncbi:MAG: AMP-binding protein [Gammaproteobacteria bacterium]|nr:AMP-binding protein [Gammaproteobacteria bacterium]
MAISYVHGVSNTPLIGDTVSDMFDRVAGQHADDEALVVTHQQIRWTYGELQRRVDLLAAGLLSIGLNVGDRVGIWAPNCAEWVITQFATAKAGLILVNVNPAYRLGELEYALNKVGCRALIVAPEFKSSDYHSMLRNLAPEIAASTPGELAAARLPDLRFLITLADESEPGFLRYRDIGNRADVQAGHKLAAVNAELQFDDPINIQFTSGTTGLPKAATLTHHNIVNNAFLVGARMKFSSADRLCIPVPMYHCCGMVLGTLASVAHGATMVLPSAGYEPGAALQAIDTEKCTAIHGVPTMFISELDHADFDRFDLSHLRTGIIAGAPCPIELMKRLISEMHLEDITIAYGMTETGPVSFQTSPEDTVQCKVSTVGTVLPHTEVKIIDEQGKVVPCGTPGELLTRGYCVMPGYWGDDTKTAETIDAANWLHSGDIAILDESGYCQIVGRLKDMLIRGGENIFPREIEEYLFQHPKVEEAEVIGVPDKKFGEEICAWIKLREGEAASEDEIRDFCREKIAHFKIPRYILFVDEFPMTITGKVQKFKMRERTIDILGLDKNS